MNEPSNCTGTFTATATVVDQPCGAYGIGKVTINTTGGNGTIQYSLDGGVFRYSNVLLLNAGTYNITAKDEGGCTTSVSFTINIAASPIVINTSSATIACGSTTTSVIISASGGTEPYIYSLNGGNYQSSNIFQNLTAGNYEILVRDSAECTNTLAFTIAQSSPPNLTILNPQAVCAPATVDLTASSITAGSDAGLSYTYWTNAEATNALNNPSTVSAGGTYYIKGIAANGCFSIKPVIATVLNQPPAPLITSNGSNNFCEGGNVTLSSSPADNYQWYKNNNLIAGATAQSYTVTSSGNYEVRTTNSCATSNSNIITITVTPRPSITATGATSFCQGSSVTLNSSAATGNQWYKNGIAITGATSQNYIATETGDYTVKISNGSCTTTASNVITVAVHQIPAAPVISQSGNNLVSSETSGNKWYNNGTLIGGATNQTYEVTTPGVYTATVTLNGCTSVSSNSITISSVNTSSSLDSNIKTGPNPTINFLNIHYSGSSRSFVVVLSELSGRVLVTVEVFDKNYQLDMRAYRPGYYVLAITTPDNGDRIQRLIMKQ
jgi:hypothetical protein